MDIAAADMARAAASVAKAGPIAFHIGDTWVGYRPDGDTILTVLGPSAEDGAHAVVALTPAGWTDVVGQMRSFINLFLAGELTFERGRYDHLADWDPALKLVHAGIPLYDPARVDLTGVDPGRTFAPDTPLEALRAQLAATGFLHIAGVFTPEEMATANAEIDRLAALARPGDDRSWWATDESGEERLCRLVYASQRSEVLAALENDERVSRLGTLLDTELRIAPDRMEGMSVLLKVPGKTQGLSNIPWHQDCGMGGHRVLCPALSVGIQLTGSSAETGNFAVVPGSHGQALHVQWERRHAGAPVVMVDTAPGDVTVHVQDVMHASPEPTGAGGRRTAYVTHYPLALWDHVGPGEAFNDVVRNRTKEAASLQ